MSKHTKGPWFDGERLPEEYYLEQPIAGGDGSIVAVTIRHYSVFGHPDHEEEMANAALIVAAVNACMAVNPENPMAAAEAIPALLAACREANKVINNALDNPRDEVVDALRLMAARLAKVVLKAEAAP